MLLGMDVTDSERKRLRQHIDTTPHKKITFEDFETFALGTRENTGFVVNGAAEEQAKREAEEQAKLEADVQARRGAAEQDEAMARGPRPSPLHRPASTDALR